MILVMKNTKHTVVELLNLLLAGIKISVTNSHGCMIVISIKLF